MSEHFGSLALPVGEFLALEHGIEYAGYIVGNPEDIKVRLYDLMQDILTQHQLKPLNDLLLGPMTDEKAFSCLI